MFNILPPEQIVKYFLFMGSTYIQNMQAYARQHLHAKHASLYPATLISYKIRLTYV